MNELKPYRISKIANIIKSFNRKWRSTYTKMRDVSNVMCRKGIIGLE